MTLAEARGTRSLADVRKLAADDFTLLWHSGFWDGPLSGIVSCEGRMHWFEMLEENEKPEEKWYRRFAVVALSEVQLALECEVHEAFRQHVGTHCDYATDGGAGEVRPSDQHHLFYDTHLEYCRSRPFEDCRVVAWFER